MVLQRLFRTTHKWTGILLSLVFLNLAATGLLLLVKKQYDWIQPPTRSGAEGGVEDFIPTSELFRIVFAEGGEHFRSLDDIDRVDFQPGKRVFKVRSKHRYAELQIDAVTGTVLSMNWRPSDLVESIHDGSFFGGWCHGYVMPVASGTLLFLTSTGLYLWLAPVMRKRRRRRAEAATEKEQS